MRASDHKDYIAAVERAEAAQAAAQAAQVEAKKASEALARAQAAQEQRMRSEAERAEAERAEAERAEREQRLGTAAREAHAKTVARVGAAIRELLEAAAQEQAVRSELVSALEAQMGGDLAAASRASRYVPQLAPFGVDRYGRSVVRDPLEAWLAEAKAAGYKV
jgi:hypothetical protein